MANKMYEYGTSPRKIDPEYYPRNTYGRKLREEKLREREERERKELEEKKKRKRALKLEKKIHHKNIALIIGMFLMLLAISYRNSLITERFNEIQNKKEELAQVEKSNEQTQVSIESSLNLENLEKNAKKELGMQKLDRNQKVYITLPKEDYTESATEEIKKNEQSSNWIKKLINKLFK